MPVLGRGAGQLLGDDRDGRQRRAELVRRGCREAVERMQLLLARQHHLGGGERIAHLPRLLGEPPHIERKKDGAGEHGGQHTEIVEGGQLEAASRVPGQRPVPVYEHDRGTGSQHAKRNRIARRQRRGRNRHRRDDQKHERVLDPAGQVEERRQLDDVVGEQRRCEYRAEPRAHRVAQAKEHVEPGGQRNQRQADADVEVEAEDEIHVADGDQLAGDAEPAQPHGRLQPQAAFAVLPPGPRRLGHRSSRCA